MLIIILYHKKTTKSVILKKNIKTLLPPKKDKYCEKDSQYFFMQKDCLPNFFLFLLFISYF